MDDDIVYSAPPSKSDEELEKGFVTAIIDQPKLLDELAKQLVTLGLAIPGLYATVLKFMGGDYAVVESAPLKHTAMKPRWLGAVIAADG